MKTLIALVRGVGLNSMFDWKWYLKDLPPNNGLKVFSCFSCGGGSSMGYKRAGFDVIGNVEIDLAVNQVYVKNLHPKYNFCMDLRKFNQLENLPAELYSLDILDGSPPCTTFSKAGLREKTWGKAKIFAEGRQYQRLDDLFFVWLDTVKKLRPKIAIAENVTGLIESTSKGYVNEIIKGFKAIGYAVQIFRLNAAFMDVPQLRERIFFIANNQHFPPLKLEFNGRLIKFGEVRTPHGKPIREGKITELLKLCLLRDNRISDIAERIEGRAIGFGQPIMHDSKVAMTLLTQPAYRACDKMKLSDGDRINISTFPQDYDFCGRSVQYICGMCVPPNMIANIASEVKRQWL